MNVTAAREFYASVEAETIPVWGNDKRPISSAWPTEPTAEQWRKAPADANIGLRHCGKWINAEADNRKVPGTSDRILAGLVGLGITNSPLVKSASGIGQHIYVSCSDAPVDISYRNLSPEVGAGELRVGIGAMSVLPASRVNGVTYELISGDWRSIPVIQWRDLLWLLPHHRVITHVDALPIPLIWRPLSAGVARLFEAIARTERGEAVGRYLSRSEAEAGIVSSLILSGWQYDDIRAEFKRRDIGHYHDAKRHADRYLETTYANALAAITVSDIRQALAADYATSESAAWSGKTGNSDRVTYLALLAECYRAGAIETSISVREVAEYGAISPDTARCAFHRLARQGLITQVHPHTENGAIATTWKLDAISYGGGENRTRVTNKYLSKNRHPIVTSVRESPPAELASRKALGPSAVQVYGHLDTVDSQSIASLARATGRARSTVRAALKQLTDHGLVARTDGDEWILGPNDLASVAAELKCEELAATRRERHAADRARYQRVVELRRARKRDGSNL